MQSLEFLKQHNVPLRSIHLDKDVHTAREVAEICRCGIAQVIKTMIFVGGDIKVAAIVGGDRRVDSKKLSKSVSLAANKLRMASSDEVLAITSCEIGTVSPCGLSPEIIAVVDNNLDTLKKVYVGSGQSDMVLEVDAEVFTNPDLYTRADISK